MSLTFRRCTHYRDDDTQARAVEINLEIWRLCVCLVLGV